MGENQPTYDELKQKLARAEALLSVLQGTVSGARPGERTVENPPAVSSPGSANYIDAYIESEQNFRNSMDNCPLGIRVVTAEGSLIYTNRAMLDILGYKTIEELNAVPSEQLYTPESYAAHLSRKEKRRRNENVPSEYEIQIRRPDGEVRTLLVLRKEIVWGGEQQYLAMYQDITDRRKMEIDIGYLAGLVQNVSDAIISTDTQKNIFSWNKAAENIYGWRAEEVLGKNVVDIVKPVFTDLTEDELMALLTKKGSWIGDAMHCRKNGEVFPVLVTSNLIKDKFGNEIGAVTVTKDITERHKMESEIRYLAGLIQSVSDAIFSCDIDSRILSWNKAAEKMYGWRAEEVLGKNAEEIIKHASAGETIEESTSILKKNGTWSGDIIHQRKNGEKFRVLATVTLIKDAVDNEVGAVCVVKDITERIKAEEALKAREALLDSVIENTPSPLWVSDATGMVIRMNQALRDLLQITDAEVIGKYNVFKDTQVIEQGCLPLVKRVYQEGATVNFTLKYQTGLEKQLQLERDVHKTLEIVISAVKDERGKVTHAICQQIDISYRVAAEKALTESQERFYGAFHYSPSMNMILNRHTMRIVEANDAFCQVTGYSRDELIGNMDLELNFWEDIDSRTSVLIEIEEKGKISNKDITFRMKNGEIRYFSMNLSIMTSGNEQYLFTSMIDITSRKQVETALQASEKRYRTALDNMMESCQIIDHDWRYVYVNEAFLKQDNQKKEKFVGHTMMEIIPNLENTDAFRVFKKCMEEHVSHRMEDELVEPNGRTRWYDLSIQPVPEGLFILSLDITERRKMETRLRYHAGLVESISDAVISSDPEYKIISWNKAAEEMYGWSEEEVIGKRIMDVTRSELITETVQDIQDTLNITSHWRGEALHYRKSGEKIDVLITVSIMRDEKGDDIGAVSVFKDITERKNAEIAVHQSEERFRHIFQAGPLGITLANLDYQYTMVNARFCEMVGYSEKELLNMTFEDVSFQDGIDITLPYLAKLKKGEQPYYIAEKRYKKKNGEIFWGSLVVTMLRDNEGKPQSYLSMVHDFTSRKQDEERIEHLNLALRSIRNINQLITREKNRDRLIQGVCDNLVTGRSFHSAWIVLLDEAKQPVSWGGTNVTRGIEGIVEAFREGEFPRCVHKALTQKKVVITRDPVTQCQGCPALGNIDGVGTMTIRLETGGRIYGILCGAMRRTVLMDEDEVSLFSEVAADITFALRDIELSSSNELLQQEQLRASKLESIGTLAGGIAHDFNNLLAGIMGNIGLAKTLLPQGSAIFDVLDEAEKAATRSRHLTQQLLTFARGGKPIKKVVDITGIIKDAATFALRGSKAKLELSLPEDMWLVEADEGQIGQVIHNLVLNADEAMPKGGTITITGGNHHQKRGETPLVAPGNYVRVDIRDNGIGIAPEQLQKIYEPYYTTKRQGSGLGLTTAYSIVKNHGGYLLADSVIDQGSVFHIYIPASSKTVKGEKIMAAKKSAQAGGKVLVMDDDEIIRKMLVSMLKLAGYEVEATMDGAEAVEKYQQAIVENDPFSAVIMDLTVPGGMGGKEAVAKLLEIDPGASVIVSSGYATDPIMSDYKKYGFSAVIAKPYSIGQLQETLAGLNLTSKK